MRVWTSESTPAGRPTRPALKANGKTYTMHMYEGANHGFHNDTTPRYDEAAATLAWQRTVDFFNRTLRLSASARKCARKWANFTDYDSLGSGTPAPGPSIPL